MDTYQNHAATSVPLFSRCCCFLHHHHAACDDRSPTSRARPLHLPLPLYLSLKKRQLARRTLQHGEPSESRRVLPAASPLHHLFQWEALHQARLAAAPAAPPAAAAATDEEERRPLQPAGVLGGKATPPCRTPSASRWDPALLLRRLTRDEEERRWGNRRRYLGVAPTTLERRPVERPAWAKAPETGAGTSQGWAAETCSRCL